LARAVGATDVVNGRASNALDEIRKLTGGLGVDYAFEAIGNTAVMAQAFRSTKKSGETIIVGVTSADAQLMIPSSFLVDEERKIYGSYMGSVVPRRDIPMLVDLYSSGRIKLDEIVTRYLSLEDINNGLESLASGEAARQIIKMEK